MNFQFYKNQVNTYENNSNFEYYHIHKTKYDLSKYRRYPSSDSLFIQKFKQNKNRT